MVLESDGIANFIAQLHIHLLTDPFGHTHGCHSSGLGAAYFTPLCKTCRVEVLGDLSCFTAAGLTNDDKDVVVNTGLHQLFLVRENGEIFLLFPDA